MSRLLLASGLAAALLLSGAPVSTAADRPAPVSGWAVETVALPATQGRTVELRVWKAAQPRAVIVFSPDGGGRPEAYERMFSAWQARGFMVIAPWHNDALARGDVSGSKGPEAFGARLEDLAIARGYARSAAPGAPLVVAGHSFGSLMSLISVGALTPAGPQADPGVKAAIVFSSPGVVRGLLTRDSYAGVAAPLLVITGDADVVPGFAADWHDHRLPFDSSVAGDKTLLVFEGGGHDLIARADDADFALLVDTTIGFIEARALGSQTAAAKLAALKAPAGVTIERR